MLTLNLQLEETETKFYTPRNFLVEALVQALA